MKRTSWRFVVALVVCTLLPAIVAHAKDKVTRPLKMQAQSQQMWQLDAKGVPVNCIRVEGWGVSTHCGLFDLGVTGETSGFLTSANGDQIFYDWPTGNPLDVTITGGKGRFSEATGKFTVSLLSVIRSVDPENGILTISLTWTASGTISY
jgi:hypothetical protein